MKSMLLGVLLSALLFLSVSSVGQAVDSSAQDSGDASVSDVGRYRYFIEQSLGHARNGEWETALEFIEYASELPVDTSYAWLIKANYAFQLGNNEDVAGAFLYLIEHYPAQMESINPRFLNYALNRIHLTEGLAQTYATIVQHLFDANFQSNHLEPSNLWQNLAVYYLETEAIDQAARVAKRIDHPLMLVGMYADKRFDPLFESNADLPSLEDSAKHYVDKLSRLVEENPRSLRLVVELTYALIIIQNYEEILVVTDSVLEKIGENIDVSLVYDDAEEHIIWILNNRAIALQAYGALGDASELLLFTSRLDEDGGNNVSQVINLANMLCDLGELQLSRNTLARVGDSLSDYGKMQVKYVEMCLALQEDNLWEALQAASYLKDHQQDDNESYIGALLATGQLDAAAAALVEWLESPKQRTNALAFLQVYAELPITLPFTELIKTNLQEVREMPTVQQAIDAYGRINRYKIRRF